MKWTDEDAAVASIAACKLLMTRKFKQRWSHGPGKNKFLCRLDKEVARNQIAHAALQRPTRIIETLAVVLKASVSG